MFSRTPNSPEGPFLTSYDCSKSTAAELVENGHIQVPETPGLGFSGLNEEVVAEFADPEQGEPFGSTDEWDGDLAHDRLWS